MSDLAFSKFINSIVRSAGFCPLKSEMNCLSGKTKLSCPTNPASVLCNPINKYFKSFHPFQPVLNPSIGGFSGEENGFFLSYFSRVTLQRRKSGGVKRVYYRVNGYATEPLRLLEADMPRCTRGASRFSSRHELPTESSSPLKAEERPAWNYHSRGRYIDYGPSEQLCNLSLPL